MATPKVFISSTFYDLQQVRYNIGDFIKNLGYEAVMHERASVTYIQNKPLEKDCYNAVSTCDIVVCIIGSHFGTQSSENELSITMNELQTAIQKNKKIYVFIDNKIFIENKTYLKNKEHGTFKSAFTNDLRIHDFILELQSSVKNHVITAFETTDDIIKILKSQFAGLFQHLLEQESTLIEEKTIYDLQETIEKMKKVLISHEAEHRDFLCKMDSTYFRYSTLLYEICKHLGFKNSFFFAKDLRELDELFRVLGYEQDDVGEGECRKYILQKENILYTMTLKNEILKDGKLNKLLSADEVNQYVKFTCEELSAFPSDFLDEAPF